MPALLRFLGLTALFLFSIAARGAPAADATAPATLDVGARTVFVFRAPLAGFPPQDRADAARKRLDKALAAGGPQRVSTQSIDAGAQVLLDGRLLFLVTPGDVNPLAGDTTASVATDSMAALNDALLERREQASPRYLLRAGGWCLAATAAYGLVLRCLAVLRRRLRAYTQRAVSHQLKRVRFRNVALLDADHVVRFVRQVAGVLVWAARLFATFLWGTFLLGQIPYFRSWGDRLRDYLVSTLFDIAGEIARAVPGLLVVAVIAALARMAILMAGSVLRRVEHGELQLGWLDRDTAPPTRRLVNVAIILFALAMAYSYLPGAHTAAFQGISVLAGLMVSLGGSSLIGQGASGLILMYTRSLRKGEYVRIGESEGTVTELGMFVTRLRTGLGTEVAVPNALVLSNTTRNYSRISLDADLAVDAAVTVGYATPWRQVHAMLLQAARETGGILAEPAPFVAQTALSDFYIEYRLVAHARAPEPRERVDVRTRLLGRIVDVFNQHGVAMTSPHFMQEPRTAHVVPPAAGAPFGSDRSSSV